MFPFQEPVFSRSFYINTEKEYKENPLLKDLDIPSNLQIEDPTIFAPKEEVPLLDPFKIRVKELPVYSIATGDKTDEVITLNNRVFGMPIREDILHRVVVWQLAKRRQGSHCVKTLSEVSGSNRKPFRQKGTGMARQGQKRAPQMRGGYKPMGPRPRDYYYPLPFKVRALGLRTALSLKWQEQNLIIVDSCSVDVIKTGAVDSVIKKIVGDDLVTIIDGETKNSNFELSARNIPRVLYLPQLGANVYDILKRKKLILSKDAVKCLTERLDDGSI